jgi:segregation and condensation protein A
MDTIAAALVPDPAGEGPTPRLALDGFDGPLALLLTMARANRIDLARISLPDLIDQLAAALQQAGPATSVSQKGDWVVMASWLLLLRSRLLLPAATAVQQAAEDEAHRLRERLADLQAAQALAAWLDHRPLLGQDVFARGQPELLGVAIETNYDVDVTEFLWACLALFDDDDEGLDATAVYLPPWRELYTIPNARERILRLLAETPAGAPLGSFLPNAPTESEVPGKVVLRRRSAWSCTFVASLELTRSGAVELRQEANFGEIHVRTARSLPPADGWDGDPADRRSVVTVSVG